MAENMFDEIRRRRLLSNAQSSFNPGQTNPLGMSPGTPPIMQNPAPPTPIDDYRSHMESAPRREDYDPGLLRKILGGVSGFSTGYFQGPLAGMQAAQQITNQPYNTAYGDWANKGQEIEKLRELYEAQEARGDRDRGRKIQEGGLGVAQGRLGVAEKGATADAEWREKQQDINERGIDLKEDRTPTQEDREALAKIRTTRPGQPIQTPEQKANEAGLVTGAKYDAMGKSRLAFPPKRQPTPTDIIKVEETVDRKLANNPKYKQFADENEFGEVTFTAPTTERRFWPDYDPNSPEYQEILRLWQEFNTEREREISRFINPRGASKQPNQLDEFEVLPSNQSSY